LVKPGDAAGTLQLWVVDVDGASQRTLGMPIPGLEATVDW
jgi:hypothetical protein